MKLFFNPEFYLFVGVVAAALIFTSKARRFRALLNISGALISRARSLRSGMPMPAKIYAEPPKLERSSVTVYRRLRSL